MTNNEHRERRTSHLRNKEKVFLLGMLPSLLSRAASMSLKDGSLDSVPRPASDNLLFNIRWATRMMSRSVIFPETKQLKHKSE